MDSLFGIPTSLIASVLAGVTVALALTTLWLAVRHPVLVKLGVRHIPRRRARSVLIVVGLALGTTIVAASFTTGDAIGYTIRELVSGSLGGVDEVVVSYRQGTRRFTQNDFQGVADGRIPTVAGDDFDASQVDEVRRLLAAEPGVAGVVGSLIRQYTLANTAQQVASGGVNLLALPSDTPAAFGELRRSGCQTPSGQECRLMLADLQEGEAYLNEAAAGPLLAQAGDRLVIYRGSRETEVTVRAVAANGELGGTQATLLVSLPWWQSVENEPGQINQILIVNQGGSNRLRYSEPIARALRASLVDDRAARELHALLATNAVRNGLRESLGSQPPPVRPRLVRLIAALERPQADDEFKLLIGDPQVLALLRPALFNLAPGTARQFVAALTNLNRLTVVELKSLSLDIASAFASALTSAFLVLGLFSIATGVMLVFLIFSLLAAERRAELGMARALGTQQGQLVQMFLFEGALYDLGASVLGVLVGLGVAVYTLDTLGGYLSDFGLRLTRYVEPRSLVIALCLGLLLTFATVTVAAWQVARLNVVAAVRNIPTNGPPPPSLTQLARTGRLLPLLWALLSRGPLLVLLGLALALVTRRWPVLMGLTALGWSLTMIGVGMALRWALALVNVPRTLRDRLGFSLAGLALLVYWSQPVPQARVFQTERFVGGLELLALAGLLMLLGAVWAIAYNLELLPSLIRIYDLRLTVDDWLARRFNRQSSIANRQLSAALRVAAAYAGRYRWRTGLAILMFALVVFTVTTAAILLSGTRYAYADLGVQAAGFDLRADVDPARLPDLSAQLAQAEAIRPEAFTAVGGQTSVAVEAIQRDAPAARWQTSQVQVVDEGWLAGTGVALTQRAPGYTSDRQVWDALRTTPGLAVLHGGSLISRDTLRSLSDPFGGSLFTLQGVTREDGGLPPTIVWVRDVRGGPPMRLQVIGILDRRVSLGQGFYTTSATRKLAGWTLPPVRTYYFRLAPDQPPRQAALGLTRSFSQQGLTATVLNEELRAAQGIRLLLNQLLQGFMGLGLVSGVVALGVLATRAVVERRQQIGVLRALGFGRGLVQAVFILESTLIAWLGIGLGVGLGIAVAHNVVQFLALQNPEIQFAIPWGQLAQIALVAYGMTLLTTLLPAWQAGRVYPAEALRYE
ncbi:MAG: ABC transporter permease [Anaerolineae bacterium]|nr:ABC transporter permease [Anaerolineae bacterium]